MHEITFHSCRAVRVIRYATSALNHANHENDSEIPLIDDGDQQEGLSALETKQKELIALLKYADLGKFVNELKDNKNL